MGRFGLFLSGCAAILLSFSAQAAAPASQAMVQKLMQPPPAGSFKRSYSAQEILNSHDIRRQLSKVDVSTIAFASNSPQLGQKQYPKLKPIAQALAIILTYNPREFFLIEGHTDAPGKKNYNKKLSFLRALNIKQILVAVYGLPAGNIAVAGYGEKFLKVKVRRSEARNRRVTFRRITAALVSQKAAPAPMTGNFRPALQQRSALPFIPPNVRSPFAPPLRAPAAKPKPQAAPFVPRLIMRRTLPFIVPGAVKPF